MSTVIESIRMFRELTGASITYHDHTGAIIPVLGRPLRFHTHPFCTAVKAVDEGRCVYTDSDRIRKLLTRYPDGFWKRCHAGVVEYVHPLGGQGVMFFGPFRSAVRVPFVLDDARGRPKVVRTLPVLRDARTIASLASLIARDVVHSLRTSVPDGDGDRRRAVERFFSQRFAGDIGASDLADTAGVSMPRLRQLMQVWYRKPFTRVLAEQRIRHACRMLISTETDLRDIARASGFIDPDYFFKVFKRLTGTTPLAYRRKNSVHRA
ncbi:MAG: AraC family transcriptional regulator [Spirochaetota bacterium]